MPESMRAANSTAPTPAADGTADLTLTGAAAGEARQRKRMIRVRSVSTPSTTSERK